jgi:hypothetical protein
LIHNIFVKFLGIHYFIMEFVKYQLVIAFSE